MYVLLIVVCPFALFLLAIVLSVLLRYTDYASHDNADVIEVQTNTIRGIDVLINGELADFEVSISKTLSVRGKEWQTLKCQ
jgi:hypothetical protein